MDLIMRGAHAIVAAAKDGLQQDWAIAIKNGRVAESGPAAAVIARYPAARILGNGKQLLMPGLIDAHSHGRGLSPIQKGVPYDYLENCLYDWARMVVLPPELCAAICAIKHLRNGCTTIHHYGFDDEGPTALARAEAGIASYLKTGIRLAYAPGVRDLNRFALEEHEFVKTLPADLAARVAPLIAKPSAKIVEDYFALFGELHARHDGADTKILLGPSWAHGATDEFLIRARDESRRRGGVPIHLHALQTPHQRAWGEWKYGMSMIERLDRLGLIDRNLVLGHAIWVTERDIEMLGAKGASITHHPSCNLHMRNGLAPVPRMIAAGINVALGLDDKTINDNEDAIMELRMVHEVHRMADYDLANTRALDAFDVLKIGTVNAARVCGFTDLGTLEVGQKADAILVDLDAILDDPWSSGDLNIAEMFVHRALGSHVVHVVVGGKVVVEDRMVRTIDVPALWAEVRAVASRGLPPAQADFVDLATRVKPHAQAWYARWQDAGTEPYYRLNARS